MKLSPSFKFLALLVLTALLLGLLSACSGGAGQTKSGYPMASVDEMPAEVQSAPESVQKAYQFAAANPEIMTKIPCYCGCGDMGHTSNYACYVSSVGADGAVVYDTHALGCSICVDITLDAMRLLEQGKTLQEIRAYVDETYSKYGPSNIP